MKRFQNILVSVDLAEGDELVSDRLVPPSEEAVRQAIWLAGISGARLLFFYALDISERARYLIEEDANHSSNVLGHAERVLQSLVQRAAEAGVSAESKVVFGKSWVEIIRQVQRGGHDLVIAGTRHLGLLESTLFGSTGMKLLRKCPSAVWITQPRTQRRPNAIVAATDFTPVCNFGVELAASLAALHGTDLSIVHAVSFGDEPHMRRAGIAEEKIGQYRTEHEAAAHAEMQQLLTHPALRELAHEPATIIATAPPQELIMSAIQESAADLLVMGTVARTGMSGILTGNTAERLLPIVKCSLLAVKPEEFVSPVTPD